MSLSGNFKFPKDTETLVTIHKIPLYFQSSPGLCSPGVCWLPCPKETWRNCSSQEFIQGWGDMLWPRTIKTAESKRVHLKAEEHLFKIPGSETLGASPVWKAVAVSLPNKNECHLQLDGSWCWWMQRGWARTVTYSSWKQIIVSHERWTSNNSCYGLVCRGQHCHLPGSFPGSHRKLCLRRRDRWFVRHGMRGDFEDKDAAASRYAQGRADEGQNEPLPHTNPARQLRSERDGLDFFLYPSPFINQGKH